MTPLYTLGLCAALLISVLLFAGAGAVLLRVLKVAEQSSLDFLLFAISLGVILLELVASVGELAPNVRTGVHVSVLLVSVAGVAGLRSVVTATGKVFERLRTLRGVERVLAALFLLVQTLQMLASLAPITGSDALHYHFTVQSTYLREGFHAPWSLLHGFFCGLSHQLILSGLALGSDGLAQGWLSTGGVIGAFATYRLAKLWCAGAWPWLAALVFALTPVAFWQTTTAGAPDIWMCAFVPVGLLAILKAQANPKPGAIILAGVFAGAAAGTKYTGVILAASFLVGFVIAVRTLKASTLFFVSAIATGFAPYLRNWLWTGDPVFPFLLARMDHARALVNQTALFSVLKDTGATHKFYLLDFLRFPLFAAVDRSHFGPWQLLGPLILALGPLAIPAVRKTIEGRIALIVWFAGTIGVGLSSGMSRFLLPLLPVALAASIGGVALLTRERFKILRLLTLLSIAGFIVAGFGAMFLYSRSALAAVAGRTSREAYLLANSPDYERSQFVNREVERLTQPGRALVFFRHLYYLRVPFVNGDPENSWEVDPTRMNSDEAWSDYLRKNQIRWVVKTADYPTPLAASLIRLEQDGILTPCASGEVETFSGSRMEGKRVKETITLYCVQSRDAKTE